MVLDESRDRPVTQMIRLEARGMIDTALKRRSDEAIGARRDPSLRGVPFQGLRGAGLVELLSEEQRRHLAQLATVRHFPARGVIYRAGADADAVFIISEGAVKSFRDLPSGRCRIAAFFFADDLFGLAAAGRYVNTAQAMTAATVYRLEVKVLTDAFRQDSELELRFLCKAVHELREAQHHTIIVARRHAAGRIAMLLRMLERNNGGDARRSDVFIPMTRSDIANYLGLSLETVVRASRRLESQGIVHFVDRHHARILDRQRFETLASAL
jgi:CRP-like cAMP-binding protein